MYINARIEYSLFVVSFIQNISFYSLSIDNIYKCNTPVKAKFEFFSYFQTYYNGFSFASEPFLNRF